MAKKNKKYRKPIFKLNVVKKPRHQLKYNVGKVNPDTATFQKLLEKDLKILEIFRKEGEEDAFESLSRLVTEQFKKDTTIENNNELKNLIKIQTKISSLLEQFLKYQQNVDIKDNSENKEDDFEERMRLLEERLRKKQKEKEEEDSQRSDFDLWWSDRNKKNNRRRQARKRLRNIKRRNSRLNKFKNKVKGKLDKFKMGVKSRSAAIRLGAKNLAFHGAKFVVRGAATYAAPAVAVGAAVLGFGSAIDTATGGSISKHFSGYGNDEKTIEDFVKGGVLEDDMFNFTEKSLTKNYIQNGLNDNSVINIVRIKKLLKNVRLNKEHHKLLTDTLEKITKGRDYSHLSKLTFSNPSAAINSLREMGIIRSAGLMGYEHVINDWTAIKNLNYFTVALLLQSGRFNSNDENMLKEIFAEKHKKQLDPETKVKDIPQETLGLRFKDKVMDNKNKEKLTKLLFNVESNYFSPDVYTKKENAMDEINKLNYVDAIGLLMTSYEDERLVPIQNELRNRIYVLMPGIVNLSDVKKGGNSLPYVKNTWTVFNDSNITKRISTEKFFTILGNFRDNFKKNTYRNLYEVIDFVAFGALDGIGNMVTDNKFEEIKDTVSKSIGRKYVHFVNKWDHLKICNMKNLKELLNFDKDDTLEIVHRNFAELIHLKRDGKDDVADEKLKSFIGKNNLGGSSTEPKILNSEDNKVLNNKIPEAVIIPDVKEENTINTEVKEEIRNKHGKYNLTGKELEDFIKNSSFGHYFKNLKNGTKEFSGKWDELTEKYNKEFLKEQDDFINNKKVNKLIFNIFKDTGIDINKRSKELREMIVLMAIKYGPNTKLFKKIFNEYNLNPNSSDVDIINALNSKPKENISTTKTENKTQSVIKNEENSKEIIKVDNKESKYDVELMASNIGRGLPYNVVAGNLKNVNSNLLTRVFSLAKLYNQKTGNKLQLYNGYRSHEYQKALFIDAVKKYGSIEEAKKHVAYPGTSAHELGLAIDLAKSPKVEAFLNEVDNDGTLKRFGLHRPIKGEFWHLEPTGIDKPSEMVNGDGIQDLKIKPTKESIELVKGGFDLEELSNINNELKNDKISNNNKNVTVNNKDNTELKIQNKNNSNEPNSNVINQTTNIISENNNSEVSRRDLR